MFADDCTLSCAIKRNDLSGAHALINLNLQSVSRWTNANKIKINAQKTKYMIFSYRDRFQFGEPVIIDTEVIEQVTSVKFLGMFLDNNLCFSYHVNHISGIIARCLGIFGKLRSFFPIRIMKSLYYALVYPYLSYGVEVWYSAAPAYVRNQIVVLQKKIVRVMNSLEYVAHTLPYILNMELLPVEYVYQYRVSQYLFKTLNIPNFDRYLSVKLVTLLDQHDHNTRGTDRFVVPVFRRVKSDSHIHCVSVKLWNSLPCNVKNKNSLCSFKREVRVHLLTLLSV